jgi:hypothetical protein
MLPVTPGISKKQADLFISNIEIIPNSGYLMVKGDVTNGGLETANAVIVSVKKPAQAVDPFKQYGVGLLKSSDFATFKITFKPTPGSTSENLILTCKDNEGRIITHEVTIDIPAGSYLANSSTSDSNIIDETSGLISDKLLLPSIVLVVIIAATIGGILIFRKQKKKRL